MSGYEREAMGAIKNLRPAALDRLRSVLAREGGEE